MQLIKKYQRLREKSRAYAQLEFCSEYLGVLCLEVTRRKVGLRGSYWSVCTEKLTDGLRDILRVLYPTERTAKAKEKILLSIADKNKENYGMDQHKVFLLFQYVIRTVGKERINKTTRAIFDMEKEWEGE